MCLGRRMMACLWFYDWEYCWLRGPMWWPPIFLHGTCLFQYQKYSSIRMHIVKIWDSGAKTVPWGSIEVLGLRQNWDNVHINFFQFYINFFERFFLWYEYNKLHGILSCLPPPWPYLWIDFGTKGIIYGLPMTKG